MNLENDRNSFIFIWQLENFRMNAKEKGEYILSPNFTVKQFHNSEWCLKLFPKGRNGAEAGDISCLLKYIGQSNQINIKYVIFASNSPFRFPKLVGNHVPFSTILKKGMASGFQSLKKVNGSKFNYPECSNDIYIICYLWMPEKLNVNNSSVDYTENQLFISNCLKQELNLPKYSNQIISSLSNDIQKLKRKYYHFPRKCFAHTIFSSERNSFFCSIDDLMNGKTSKKSFFIVSVTSMPDLLFTIFLDSPKSIAVEISATKTNFSLFCFCKISIFDSSKQIQHSTEREYCFSSDESNTLNIKLPFEDNFIEKGKDSTSSFPQLFCEIAFSNRQIFSWIERVEDLSFICPDSSQEESMSHSFQAKMSQLYTSKILCDVVLRLRSKVFEAHKALLCTHSPVFFAMFQTDMKESKKSEVFISDLDADTVERMLKFIYTESLEDINFEAALKLYEASDKYEMVILQEKCASFIKYHLTTANACPALCLGDAHNDVKLKTFVSSFILENWKEILVSEEWKFFSQENVYLANEILRDICMKLSHIQII